MREVATDSFVPCPGCARHIRTSEETCPFCKVVVPADARVPVPVARLGGRHLSRAALVLASAAAVASCGKEPKTDPNAPDGAYMALPPYGQPMTADPQQPIPLPPPVEDAGGVDAQGGLTLPAYGVPIAREAGAARRPK